MASLAEMRIEDVEEPSMDPQARPEELRLLEAMLFASTEPLDQATLASQAAHQRDSQCCRCPSGSRARL